MTICLILAAGGSSRMQQPKMLLPYNGSTLLQHLLNIIAAAPTTEPVVVTGRYDDEIAPILEVAGVCRVYNPDWMEGMAASIQCGVRHVQAVYPKAERVLLLVCDQPFISTALLNDMQATMDQTQQPIVACTYAGTAGTPVLFHRSFIPELLTLQGDKGAKQLLQQHAASLALVAFPQGAVDIDSPEDYERLTTETEK